MASKSNQLSDRRILRWKAGKAQETSDTLIVEQALELRMADKTLAVLMRTPGNDIELIRGLLWSEGVIRRDEKPAELTRSDPNTIELHMDHELVKERWAERDVITSSACGVCGASAIARLEELATSILSDLEWSADKVTSASARMRSEQALFHASGAVHGAALFNRSGELVQCREDVGRHNAVDKLVGWALGESLLPLSDHVLMVSSRLSYEIVQKAICAGIPLVLGVSAPSSLAVDMAEQWRVTLAGFVRGQGFNVYSHAYRIVPQNTKSDAESVVST
ncbi:MAG: formate dehydrogenase accessory sulfurtransferase FdhD [Kofleriaceae bacterium]|nr:formate dehydrogenase accessory sulfurtransferase FdhD [Kofleriaceae bacterium]